MIELGVNVDPYQRFDPATIAASGAAWVRCVLKSNDEELAVLHTWIEQCHSNDLKVLGVLALESFPDPDIPEAISRYAGEFSGLLDAWQVANEPDGIEGSSSWPLAPGAVNELLRQARASLPDAKIVGPGLASGQPSYVEGLDLGPVDAIALHPYGQRPSPDWPTPDWCFGNLADFVELYRPFGKPIWVTEYGGPLADFDSPEQHGEYYERMAKAFGELGIEVACAFCWDESMVPGFGLLDHGSPTPAYAAFCSACQALNVSPPLA